jgi:D-3-phosphoglycerate dehydrogenase
VRASPIRVLLLEQIHPDAVELLQSAGFDVTNYDRAMDSDELISLIGDVHLLGIRSKTHVTDKVLASAPNLLAIGAFCIGTNQIDLLSATAHGVTVFNAPFSNTRSVVELAIAELISLTRRLTE